MPQSTQEQKKVLVLRAFDLLFNKRDYAADVIQDEATERQSKSKAPMFGDTLPTH